MHKEALIEEMENISNTAFSAHLESYEEMANALFRISKMAEEVRLKLIEEDKENAA